MGSLFKPLRVESENFLRLDVLRFIASCGIALFHFRDLFGLPTYVVHEMNGLTSFVDLFFVISGIVISHVYGERMDSAAGYVRFMRARIARLGPLHWATLAFCLAEGVIAARNGVALHHAENFNWNCLVPNLTLTHAWGTCHNLSFNGVSWSISAEMFLYLAFPLILLVGRAGPLALLLSALGAMAGLYGYSLSHLGTEPWWTWTYHFGMLRAVPAFFFGAGLYRFKARLAAIPGAGMLTWSALALFVGLLASGVDNGWLLPLVYAIPALALAADTRRQASGWVSSVAPLGQLTFSIYMLHPLVRTVMVTIVGDNLLQVRGAGAIVWAAISVLTVLPVSYISLMAFEDPARIWINGRGRARHGKGLATEVAGDHGS
jgi:peptidoglycan/LPS O-acetylase OafA/YrhL